MSDKKKQQKYPNTFSPTRRDKLINLLDQLIVEAKRKDVPAMNQLMRKILIEGKQLH
jgi:hypothetical protein